MNENMLITRHIASVRAFWAAETGISEAMVDLPNPTAGVIGSNCVYNTTTTSLAANYYRIDSTGTAAVVSGGEVSRRLSSVVRTAPVEPNKFQHAIRTTVDLDVGGTADINGPQEEGAALDFAYLFGLSKGDLEDVATHVYTSPPNNVTPVDGITWINLSGGEEVVFSSTGWSGSGILVINGDAKFTGGTFDGIVYVIGDLTVGAGNPTLSGSVLVESDPEVILDTKITGNVTINYDSDEIEAALGFLQFVCPAPVSWREQCL